MSSSVIPSAKYSSFGSGLRFCNGKTATLCLSSVGSGDVNAGGTKLFDRPMSVGCKGSSLEIRAGGYRAFRRVRNEHS